ncbi:MAG: hypothetical protein PHS52_01845 [Desulfotomaculaceae bacterium]|nr:hypothetical protein [Desulfotomaculaceae bacterium]
MKKWPCLDCRHYDTFDSHEDSGIACKLGHVVTHMKCDFREPYSIYSCKEDFT